MFGVFKLDNCKCKKCNKMVSIMDLIKAFDGAECLIHMCNYIASTYYEFKDYSESERI